MSGYAVNGKPCPHRVDVPAAKRVTVQAMRAKLQGEMVIVDDGGPTITVWCEVKDDAVLLKLSA